MGGPRRISVWASACRCTVGDYSTEEKHKNTKTRITLKRSWAAGRQDRRQRVMNDGGGSSTHLPRSTAVDEWPKSPLATHVLQWNDLRNLWHIGHRSPTQDHILLLYFRLPGSMPATTVVVVVVVVVGIATAYGGKVIGTVTCPELVTTTTTTEVAAAATCFLPLSIGGLDGTAAATAAGFLPLSIGVRDGTASAANGDDRRRQRLTSNGTVTAAAVVNGNGDPTGRQRRDRVYVQSS